MRIVLDTAALISALRSSNGAAAEIVRLVLKREVELLLDFKLVCEYREVALRPEHLEAAGRSRGEVETVIEAVESVAIPVFVSVSHRPLSPDPNDDMVLDVAINGHADAIVTNNLRDFRKAAGLFGIAVRTPKAFLLEIRR
ncbi:MAG: putative toxin-antitoxin system toxin component, PIN family [Terracidiphilus sp.]